MKRTVLHVYQDFYPKRGGIEDHILTLAQSSSQAYNHVVLVAASGPATCCETVAGVQVIRAAAWGRHYTPLCPTMPAWMRRLSPAIVHLHHPCPMAFVACLLARLAAPVVVGYHNDIVKQRFWLKLYQPVQQAILQRAEVVLVGTQSYLDASPYLIPFRAKCRVVPYGIPVDRLAPTRTTSAQAALVRARYGGPLVLFVGRLCYYKGLEVAVKAMREVDATLLIVGQGPLLASLRRQIRSLNLLHKVILVGPVDEVALATYYHACDLLILPSTYTSEAFGLVMLQAQACAKPVVCSDLPGLSTVNVHGQTGLLTPPGDPSALAGAINHLLGNFVLRRQLGQAGREQVEKHYTSQLMAQRIEEIYDGLRA